MPGISSRRSTAPSAASDTVSIDGPGVGPSRRGSTGWASGIAASSCSMRAVSVSIWAVSLSIWSSSIRREFGVVVVEPAVEGGEQSRVFGLHAAPRQPGEHLGIALVRRSAPRSWRVRTRPMMSVATADSLIRASSSSFSSRCTCRDRSWVRSCPQPGVVAQSPDRRRRHETRPQQALLGQLGQPDGVELVRFGPAGDVLHVRALTSCTDNPTASSR